MIGSAVDCQNGSDSNSVCRLPLAERMSERAGRLCMSMSSVTVPHDDQILGPQAHGSDIHI